MNISSNNIIEFWDEYHSWNTSPTTDVCDILSQEIPKHINSNASLLEIGCGSGVIMKHLMMSYSNVVGCDISIKAVSNSKKLLGPTARVAHLNSDTFFFKQERYDMILLVKTLGAVGNDDELKELTHNAIKVLKDRGTLIIIDFAINPNIEYFENCHTALSKAPTKFIPQWSRMPFYHFSTTSIAWLFSSMQLTFHKNINLLSCNNNMHPGIMCVMKKGVNNGN